jgi:hypothetical protein
VPVAVGLGSGEDVVLGDDVGVDVGVLVGVDVGVLVGVVVGVLVGVEVGLADVNCPLVVYRLPSEFSVTIVDWTYFTLPDVSIPL